MRRAKPRVPARTARGSRRCAPGVSLRQPSCLCLLRVAEVAEELLLPLHGAPDERDEVFEQRLALRSTRLNALPGVHRDLTVLPLERPGVSGPPGEGVGDVNERRQLRVER